MKKNKKKDQTGDLIIRLGLEKRIRKNKTQKQNYGANHEMGGQLNRCSHKTKKKSRREGWGSEERFLRISGEKSGGGIRP